MTTKEFSTLAGQQTGPFLPPRLLGTLGILGGPFLLIEGLIFGFAEHADNQLVGLLQLIYISGWICSIIGLGKLGVTGRRFWGKAVLGIQLVGLTFAAGLCIINIINPAMNPESLLYILTDIGWPFSHAFMLIVGIVTLAAKVWTGWRRFAPLLCGLVLPTAMLSGIITGEMGLAVIFLSYTAVAFVLLGYAVRTGQAAAVRA